MARIIETFTMAQSAEGYLLQIEDDEGETMEFVVSYDQLELIADEIDRYLELDADDARVDGEEGEDEDALDS